MAFIYLGTKNGTYKCSVTRIVEVTIKVSRQIYDKCNNFELVKYKIEYPGSYEWTHHYSIWLSYYDLFIYTGSGNNSKGSYKYAYYWPKTNDDIVKEVDVYYSLLNSKTPVSVVFTTRSKKIDKYYYTYNKLTKEGTKYYRLNGKVVTDGKDLGQIVNGGDLYKQLVTDYNDLTKSKKVIFKLGDDSNGQNKKVLETKEYIGTKNKFTKVIFTPTKENTDFFLLSTDFFKSKFNTELKNYTDFSDLSKIKGNSFNGIILYYINSDYTVLLIEFINEFSKTDFKRKDKEGKCWKNEEIKYDNDKDLENKLDEISSGLKSGEDCKEQENSRVESKESSIGQDDNKQDNEKGPELSDSRDTNHSSSETIGHGMEDPRRQNSDFQGELSDQETTSESGDTNWAAIGGSTVGVVGLGGTGFALYKFNHVVSSFIRAIV